MRRVTKSIHLDDALLPQLLNRPTPKHVAEATQLRFVRSIRGIGFQPVKPKMTGSKPLYTPQLFWTPVSLLTGERVLKLDRLSSVKPPFFHSLAAKGGERVEEWAATGASGSEKPK